MIDLRTASNTYARTLLETCETLGISRDVMLQGIMLTAHELVVPNGRVRIPVMIRLWQRALTLSSDPLLGLKVGQQSRPSTYHVVGHVSMNCATKQQSIDDLLRYQRLVSEAGTFSTERLPEKTVLTYQPQPDLDMLPAQIEAIFVGLVQQSRWLTGRLDVPAMISFVHAPQGDSAAYRAALGVIPRFNRPTNSLHIPQAQLHEELPQSDKVLYELHRRVADQLLDALPPVGFVSGFARQWLDSRPAGRARQQDLAITVGSSTRQLQRRLREEGTNWTDLTDDARKRATLERLSHGQTLEEAAAELGYHDASSLSRAVRRWCGTTPGKWIKSAITADQA